MKITKNQLKRIIKEEKAKILAEGVPVGYRLPDNEGNLLLMLNDIVDKLLIRMDAMDLANELRGLANDVEDSKYVNVQNNPRRNEDI